MASSLTIPVSRMVIPIGIPRNSAPQSFAWFPVVFPTTSFGMFGARLAVLVALQLGLAHCALPATFTYLDYGQIVTAIHQIHDLRPDLVHLSNAQVQPPHCCPSLLPLTAAPSHTVHLFTGAVVGQDEFGVASPGTCGPNTPCKQWFVRITNEATLQAAAGSRPQVFFSGCLHGDERIGPTSVRRGTVG